MFDAPDIIALTDPGLDNGSKLEVSWELSNDDALVDQYNVYRAAGTLESHDEFRWLRTVPHGTSSIVDSSVVAGVPFVYMVSAAHHGNHGGTGGVNRGIWNDFSAPAQGASTNDFPIIQCYARQSVSGGLDSVDETPAIGCPQSDWDQVVVEILLDPAVFAGVAATAFQLSEPVNETILFHSAGAPITADSSVSVVPPNVEFADGYGRTTFTIHGFSGCGVDSAVVSVYGMQLGYAHLNIKSPDVMLGGVTNGRVDLLDFGTLGASYTSPPKLYNACVDYEAAAGEINLNDFAAFSAHWGHAAPGGESAPEAASTAVSGTVALEFEESHPLLGEHTLRATMSFEGVPPFKAAMFALRNENPKLEFVGWTELPGYAGETISTETIRDGRREVFIGVFDGDATGGDVTLGTAVFRVVSDQQLVLTDEDLALVTADLLSSTDQRSTLALDAVAVRRSVASVEYKNELAQNYPNPFNPTTTISFSLAQAADASLSIYDVRGALVKLLHNGRAERGIHRVVWDGSSNSGQKVASGVYFYKLVAGSFTDTKKLTLIK
ncbi:MAG TPA: FlgD immunoglobulin-like domain containing protein [Candidatus Krumholzibacteria bacterium]|nr:FlgD immunoglobulin-like domain containing protein [Candidatus Krumholzibacteria bacterium]